MKFNWEQKNTVNVITGVLIFTISILCYFIFSNMKSIISYTTNIKYVLMPFILGGSIAYILNFFVKFFENCFLKYKNFFYVDYIFYVFCFYNFTFKIYNSTVLLKYSNVCRENTCFH